LATTWTCDLLPEITTSPRRSSAGSPELLVFLETKITNAGADGTNRLIKQVKRAACGFRNKQNYRIQVRLHCTRNNTRMPAR
jgi:transposase